jgi:hypothetical protein
MGKRCGLGRRIERINLGLRCYRTGDYDEGGEDWREECSYATLLLQMIARKAKLKMLEVLCLRTDGVGSQWPPKQTCTSQHVSVYGVRLFLYSRSRILEPPLSAPNLRCHYTHKERYRQNHGLTTKAHARASSRNPLELEVDDAETTRCPLIARISIPLAFHQRCNARNLPPHIDDRCRKRSMIWEAVEAIC